MAYKTWEVVPQHDGTYLVRLYVGPRSGKQIDAVYDLATAMEVTASLNYHGNRPVGTKILRHVVFDPPTPSPTDVPNTPPS
jgi:hypothetical protein